MRDFSQDHRWLSLNTATVRKQGDLADIIDACARRGIRAIDPWRDQVQAAGLAQVAKQVKDAGIALSGYCRGGFFPAADAAGLRAALEDNRRAVVMGTRSFGKGSVQSIIPIGGRGALRLTTALYYTPSGRSIQGQGITPDVVGELPRDQQVANALVTYESDLFHTLPPTGPLAPKETTPVPPRPRRTTPSGGDHPINPAVIGTPQDAQLNAAIDYLKRHRSAAR